MVRITQLLAASVYFLALLAGARADCRWDGTAPFCNGKCDDGEIVCDSSRRGDGSRCWTGHKKLCCTDLCLEGDKSMSGATNLRGNATNGTP